MQGLPRFSNVFDSCKNIDILISLYLQYNGNTAICWSNNYQGLSFDAIQMNHKHYSNIGDGFGGVSGW